MHWTIFACKDSYNPDEEFEEDYDRFIIDDDFHGLVYQHYKSNPCTGVRTIVPPGALDEDGMWALWQPELDGRATKKRRKK